MVVTPKEVERISEGMGKQIEVIAIRERDQAMDGKVIPLLPPVPKLYIAEEFWENRAAS